MQLIVQHSDLSIIDNLTKIASIHGQLERSGSLAAPAEQYKENESKFKGYFWNEHSLVFSMSSGAQQPLVDVVLLLALLRDASCVDPLVRRARSARQ